MTKEYITKEQFGWEEPNHALGVEGGWTIEGGEEAYRKALGSFLSIGFISTVGTQSETVSEQIDQFITNHGGNARDALNCALVRIEYAERMLLNVMSENADHTDMKYFAACYMELYSPLFKK